MRAAQIGAREIGVRQIGARQIGIAQIRAGKIGALEPRLTQVGIGKIRTYEICARQRSETQKGVPKARMRQIDRSAVDRTHLAIANTESQANQVGNDRWIFGAPLVPGTRAATQHFNMFGVASHHLRLQRSTSATQRDKSFARDELDGAMRHPDYNRSIVHKSLCRMHKKEAPCSAPVPETNEAAPGGRLHHYSTWRRGACF